jgi:hypothetical protein
MCGAPATTVGFRSPGWIHTVTAPALVGGADYTYLVGDDAGMTGTGFTQPTVGGFPFGIAAYGDEGGRAPSDATIENDFPPAPHTSALVAGCVDAGACHAVLHNGDISYARGYAADHDTFMAMNARVLARVPCEWTVEGR